MPSQRTHRKVIIVPTVIQFQLIAEVLKRVKRMGGIETLVIFTVTAFNLTVMSGRKGLDQLMFYSVLHKSDLKDGRLIGTAIRAETFGKFLSIVSLYTLNRAWKSLD